MPEWLLLGFVLVALKIFWVLLSLIFAAISKRQKGYTAKVAKEGTGDGPFVFEQPS